MANKSPSQAGRHPTRVDQADQQQGCRTPNERMDKPRFFESLYGFGEIAQSALSAFRKKDAKDASIQIQELNRDAFDSLAREELADIAIRKDLFPDGALRSIGWEILVALYRGEDCPKCLARNLGYDTDDCMSAAFERHLACLEAADLVVNDNQGECNPDLTTRLTPDAVNMVDCYFRERFARIART